MKNPKDVTGYCLAGLLGSLCVAAPAMAQTAAADDETLQEVVVTGSLLQVSPGFTAPTPVTVVSAETIQERAPANILQVLNEQPAFRTSNSDTTRNAGQLPQNGQNSLDLRGLGGNRVLVLINGQRAVATNWTGTVDTDIIPVGLVERIETVTGGASAAYGSDAVAGVVNVILRDKMQGVTAHVQGGMTETGGGTDYSAGFAAGTAFAGDRGHVIFGLDYNRTSAIKNPYDFKWGRAEIGTVNPSGSQRTTLGLPQQVLTTDVEPGTAAPGGLYQKSPGVAYTFDANGNPVQIGQGTVWGTGNTMTGSTANYGYTGVAYVRVPSLRIPAYGRVSFDFTDKLTAFAEVNYDRNVMGWFKSGNLTFGPGGNPGALTVSASSPFVTPAMTALLNGASTFQIGRINTEFGGGVGSSVRQTVDTHRIVLGLTGGFGESWKWKVYGQSGRTDLGEDSANYSVAALQYAINGCSSMLGLNTNNPPGNLSQTALAQYNQLTGKTCVPFNPFGVSRNSAAALAYPQFETHQDQHLIEDVGAANLSGTVLKLPAGDLSVAFGAEARREHVDAVSDPLDAVGYLLASNLVQFRGGYHVKEAYFESGIPVFKDLPFAKALDVNVAARRTDYEISGPVTTWKAGFTWKPLDQLMFRATRSRDIRAPNYFEMFLVGGQGGGSVYNDVPSGVVGRNGTVNVNPLGPGAIGTTNRVTNPIIAIGSGGGTGLVPEIAFTSTAGVVYEQNAFHASVDYYNVTVTGAVGFPGFQGELDLCAQGAASHCQNIIFDSTVPGGVSLVEGRMANLNVLTLKGWDFEVAYRRPMVFELPGNLSFRGLMNYAPVNKNYNPLTLLTQDNTNTLGAQPKIGFNLDFGYSEGRLTANVLFKGFMGKVRGNGIVYNPDGSIFTGGGGTVFGPEDAGYNVANNNTNNRNRWPGQTIVSPSLTYKVNDHVSVFGNIDNIFDVGPPALSTNATYYDLIGRRYRVGARMNF